MSRVIKFRGWNSKAGTMVDLHKITPLALADDFRPALAGAGVGVYVPDHPEIEIMQFTGLHDRNGVEVFEGDILEHFNKTFSRNGKPLRFVMEWDADRAAWSTYHPKDSFFVAGNKWANPELLEGEKV